MELSYDMNAGWTLGWVGEVAASVVCVCMLEEVALYSGLAYSCLGAA